jgi:hypothetical protein
MINIFKSGGPWKKDGKEYTVKSINSEDKVKFLSDGWVSSLDEVKAKKKAKTKVKQDDNKE